MATALVKLEDSEPALRYEFGPIGRALGRRYCPHVRVRSRRRTPSCGASAARASWSTCMRTAAWVNFLYLAWAMVSRGAAAGPRGGEPAALVHAALAPDGPARRLRRALHLRAPPGRLGARLPQDDRDRSRRRKERPRGPLPRPGGAGAEERPAGVPRSRAVRLGEVERPRSSPAWRTTSSARPRRPGFLHSVLAFLRNYQRAQFRVGEPIDLQAFVAENAARLGRGDGPQGARRPAPPPGPRDARRLRAALKPPERLIDETLRDRTLRKTMDEQTAARSGKPGERSRARGAAATSTPSPPASTPPSLAVAGARCWTGSSTASTTASRWTRRASTARSKPARPARPSSSAPATRATSTTW